MNDLEEERAREVVEQLKPAGLNCGLLAVQGTVVLRSPGAPFTDTPMPLFNESDLRNAVALDLLEKQKMTATSATGSYEWEWYVTKKKK